MEFTGNVKRVSHAFCVSGCLRVLLSPTRKITLVLSLFLNFRFLISFSKNYSQLVSVFQVKVLFLYLVV